MSTLLALDLGITTGWAALHGDAVDASGVILAEGFEEELKRVLLLQMPTHSVAERPVIFRGKLGAQLEEIISATRRVLDHQVVFVDAVDWKDSQYKRVPLQRGFYSPHERDAIRMGLWYFHTRLNSN